MVGLNKLLINEAQPLLVLRQFNSLLNPKASDNYEGRNEMKQNC